MTPKIKFPNFAVASLFLFVLSALTLGCEAPPSVTPAAPAYTALDTEVSPEIWPEITSAVALDPAIEENVGVLMERMSLEEKVGQVIQSEIQHTTPEDVRQYHLGSVLNGGGSHPGGNKQATVEIGRAHV